VAFRNNIYTKKNKWNIQGETRFSYYPEYVYGSSDNNNSGQKLLIAYKYVRFYQTVLKQLKPYLLAGIGYNLDYHINVETLHDTMPLSKFIDYEHGTRPHQNSLSSGITFNVLYDSRNNALNPLPGGYVNIIYRVNPYFLGNGNNTWKSIYFDTRKYISLAGQKRHVLALWNYIWVALNKDVPYLDLPGIGYEPYQRSGRGIQQNRYRGKTLVYLEGEYRSDLTDDGLLGFVVFTNFNANTGPGDGRFIGLHPAAGAGLRVKFNKRSNTNIAIDFGISKGYSTVVLNLGEAF
jgi:outer membrane protein assembly factor BamA